LGLVVKHIAEIVEDVISVASQFDLTINVFKTKYMINIKKKGNDPEEIEINGQRYENTEIFKCLGSFVTNTNEVEREVKARIIAGNKCYHALRHILIHSLGGFYRTIIR
jgi:hypothetical protein